MVHTAATAGQMVGIINKIGDVVDIDDEIDLIVAEARIQKMLGSRAGA